MPIKSYWYTKKWLRFEFLKAIICSCMHLPILPLKLCILSRIHKESYTLLHIVFMDQQHCHTKCDVSDVLCQFKTGRMPCCCRQI